MNIQEYLNNLREKVRKYDKDAKNPFLESQSVTNPFRESFSQTYIWVETDEEED